MSDRTPTGQLSGETLDPDVLDKIREIARRPETADRVLAIIDAGRSVSTRRKTAPGETRK